MTNEREKAMVYQIEFRKADGDEWQTFCDLNRPREFGSYDEARTFALDSGDERLANQFRIRPAGGRPDRHAAALGRRGGRVRSAVKAAAARLNLERARAAKVAARKVTVEA